MAFIGQVKAGKSSFINALIQKPNFLPTDVNPSTAVVTKLVLGSRSYGSDTALFHFFTEAQWDNLAAEGPLPQERSQMFSLPASRQKLNELQKRAEKSLGKDFNKLLGKHHLFSSVTPQLLQQYVSASEDFTNDRTNQGAYSDLTRVAEVFLDSNSNSYPSVLIDTPGVNDLYFARDDITYANLADAEVYVMLLTALQPLSGGDLSLLRLLRGLQKRRIIAVINRIDILANPAEDVEKLEDFVRQTLKKECPQATIPVVSASALWGNLALSLNESGPKLPIPESFLAYANKLGLDKLAQDSRERSHFCAADREMLTACSGIPRILKLIGSLIATAVTEEQLLPCSSTLAAIAHNTATSFRFARKALTPTALVSVGSPAMVAGIKSKAYDNYKQIDLLTKNIDKFLSGVLTSVEQTIFNEVQALENYVSRSIGGFANVQADKYFRSGGGDFVHAFTHDALAFRSELADSYALYHLDILKVISERHRQAESGLRKMVKALLPALDNVVQFGMAPRKDQSSSIVSLGKATSLESVEFWDWFASQGPKREQDYLRRRIVSEFLLILNEVIEASRNSFGFFAGDGIRRLRLLSLSAIFPLAEQTEASIRFYKEWTVSGGEAETAAWKDFDKQVEQKIKHYDILLTQFSELKKRCLLCHLP